MGQGCRERQELYHKAQAGSCDVGKVGEATQEPSTVWLSYFLNCNMGPKVFALLPFLCIIFILLTICYISVKKLTKKTSTYYRHGAQCCEGNRKTEVK